MDETIFQQLIYRATQQYREYNSHQVSLVPPDRFIIRTIFFTTCNSGSSLESSKFLFLVDESREDRDLSIFCVQCIALPP
jgi:hypothetical protein